MKLLAAIREKVAEGYELSRHAAVQSLARGIAAHEMREAFLTAELIEDYPHDKYGPSCLLLGWTVEARPLHIHCSHPSRHVLKIITVYQPDPGIWIDFRTRRR